MRREAPPQKYVHQARVRITQEALEGAQVLPTHARAPGIVGFDISVMADSPEEAKRNLVTAMRRLAETIQHDAMKIAEPVEPDIWHAEDYSDAELRERGVSDEGIRHLRERTGG